MAFSFRSFLKGLRLVPNASTLVSAKGDVEVLDSNGKLNYHNGTTASPVVTEAHSATLTNKTLTSPAITTPTGIVKGDVGLGNVDNTSDATKNSATATLSNKTFSDAVTLAEIATPSTPSSGNGKIYFKSDGFLYQLNDDGSETKVGAGNSGINYIANPDAESNTTGWVTYADAAGSQPVNGTGGSANITFTRNTSNPLRGVASFLLTKDAVNRQGEGVSYDFTTTLADKGKNLSISFDATVSSGTYATGDLTVYIYDVTNATVIQPSNYEIGTGTAGDPIRVVCIFQTATNSTSYRLILHTATTSASAYAMKFDNFIVGPQYAVVGAVITDMQSYTPTISAGFGTATDVSFKWARIGQMMHVQGTFTAGTVAASVGTISLPSGYTVDTNALVGPTISTQIRQVEGFWWRNNASANALKKGNLTVFANTPTTLSFTATDYVPAQSAYSADNASVLFSNNDVFQVQFSVPISGWSSNTTMSASTRSAPTQQRFTSGSGTYTTPNDVKYIKVRMVGAGGGGAGGGTASAGSGGAGNNTTFGTSLLTANGGGGGGAGSNSIGGSAGSGTINSPAFGTVFAGNYGSSSGSAGNGTIFLPVGSGASGPFGGSGNANGVNAVGFTGAANSGAGGSGGGGGSSGIQGASGGSGGYIEAIIPNPSGSYSYSIGTGGTAGTAGTSGQAGGAGGTGYIEVTEYYRSEGSIASNTGVTTISTIDSQTKSSNGAVIANGNNLVMQTADATSVGLVSTSAQTFAGNKTFSGVILGSAGSVSAPMYSFSGDTNNGIYSTGADNIDFATAGVHRVKIGSGGKFIVGGTTAPSNRHEFYVNSTTDEVLQIQNNENTSASDGRTGISIIKGSNTTTAGSNHFIDFSTSGGGVGQGHISSNGTNAVAFFTSSDLRIKKDVQPIPSALDKIMLLNPVTFKWKQDDSEARGFIAQEVEQVLPHLVSKTDDGVRELAPGDKAWSMTEAGFVPYLVKAIQELKQEIETLKAQIGGN